VFWGFVMAGLAGFALGSAFKPPALIAVSLLIVVGAAPLVFRGTFSLLEAAGVLVTLQAAYLAGLAAILAWRRTCGREAGARPDSSES